MPTGNYQETSKPSTEKLIVNTINSGVKYTVVSITDITTARKRQYQRSTRL